jgi:hypothetical protein
VRRFKSQTELGLRWLNCGWRLFVRNPALLGGMGLCGAALVSVLSFVPIFSAPLIGLFMPFLLGSVYLTIDTLIRQKALKPSAPKIGLRQAPKALLSVVHDENRLVTVSIAGLYALFVALIVSIVGSFFAGRALDGGLAGLSGGEILGFVVAKLIGLFVYFWLAGSLVYALPLTFFHKEPLIPAIGRSLRTSLRYAYALAVVLALLLLPAVIGGIAGAASLFAGYLAGFLVGVVVLPVTATSLYCSYRTIFPPPEAVRPRMQPPSGGLRWSAGAPKAK